MAMMTTLTQPKQYAKRGFALLISVIFMTVMLSFGLALSSLAYKQQILASSAVQSQYAFYAADSALECALFADQKLGQFVYASYSQSTQPNPLKCENINAIQRLSYSYNTNPAGTMVVKDRLSLDGGLRCADVSIYKVAPGGGINYIFSQGYDVPCATVASPNGARYVTRGISVHY
jgi:hypothetical protein